MSFGRCVVLAAGSAVLLMACGPGPETEPSLPVVDCDAVTVPSYHDLTIWRSCNLCHASTLTGANRQGAPEGIDYDTYEAASAFAYIGAVEVNSGTMPFTGTVTDEEKEAYYAWALCGTPEGSDY